MQNFNQIQSKSALAISLNNNLKTKNLLKKISAITLLAVGILLSFSSDVFAQSSKSVTTPTIRLNGLQNFRGAHLTVYFASGLQSSLPTQINQMILDEVAVNGKQTFTITGDNLDIAPLQLERPKNGKVPYNKVLFVIHSSPQFSWLNYNGTVPKNEKASANNSYTKLNVLSYVDFQDLIAESPNRDFVNYTFQK